MAVDPVLGQPGNPVQRSAIVRPPPGGEDGGDDAVFLGGHGIHAHHAEMSAIGGAQYRNPSRKKVRHGSRSSSTCSSQDSGWMVHRCVQVDQEIESWYKGLIGEELRMAGGDRIIVRGSSDMNDLAVVTTRRPAVG
jgi:hypothetical protein